MSECVKIYDKDIFNEFMEVINIVSKNISVPEFSSLQMNDPQIRKEKEDE